MCLAPILLISCNPESKNNKAAPKPAESTGEQGASHQGPFSAPPVAKPHSTTHVGELTLELEADAKSISSIAAELGPNAVVEVDLISEGQGATFKIDDYQGGPVELRNEKIDHADGGAYLDQFEMTAPDDGRVRIELTGGQKQHATLSIGIKFSDGVWLGATAEPFQSQPGGSAITLRAQAMNGSAEVLVGTAETVSARLRVDGKWGATIELFDDGLHGDGSEGDGVFCASIDKSLTAHNGSYYVVFHAKLALPRGVVERTAIRRFDIRAAAQGAPSAGK